MLERTLLHRAPVALLLTSLLGASLLLVGCGGSDDNAGSTTTPDTFTVIIDGGAPTLYTETAASNPFGYDPYITAWFDTTNTQIHLFVATGVGATVDLIVAVTYSPPDATGTPGILQEVRYEYDWDMASDPINLDDVNGTINIQTAPAAVGDVVQGTFTGFSGFVGGGPISTLDGSFRVTRGADDLH